MRFTLPIPLMVVEAREQINSKRRLMREQLPAPVDLIVEILIFILVFLACALVLEGIVTVIFLMPLMFLNETFQSELNVAMQSGQNSLDFSTVSGITNEVLAMPEASIVTLLATIGGIVGVAFYCRFIEGRRLTTMGFRRGRIFREYLVGLLVGVVMFSAAVLIAVITGTMTYGGLAGASSLLILLFFFGFAVQGMSEEVLCRGYFLISLARRQHIAVAVFVSSCVFGAMHLFNDNVVTLGVINIILFGCFEAIYMLKRGNIWGAAAIHTAWNFTQGNVFGISVSGMPQQPSILLFEPTAEGVLMNGGAFGLEAGLASSIVLAAAIVFGLLMKCVDPAPQVLSGSGGRSQLILIPGAQRLPIPPLSPEYWQPPITQASIGSGPPVPPDYWPPPSAGPPPQPPE